MPAELLQLDSRGRQLDVVAHRGPELDAYRAVDLAAEVAGACNPGSRSTSGTSLADLDLAVEVAERLVEKRGLAQEEIAGDPFQVFAALPAAAGELSRDMIQLDAGVHRGVPQPEPAVPVEHGRLARLGRRVDDHERLQRERALELNRGAGLAQAVRQGRTNASSR